LSRDQRCNEIENGIIKMPGALAVDLANAISGDWFDWLGVSLFAHHQYL
jgi:hypothetical protein